VLSQLVSADAIGRNVAIDDVNQTSIVPVNVVLTITANAAFRCQFNVPVSLDLDEGKIKIDMPLLSCPTTVVRTADTAGQLRRHCCCWWR
jgi:hypothetical protein